MCRSRPQPLTKYSLPCSMRVHIACGPGENRSFRIIDMMEAVPEPAWAWADGTRAPTRRTVRRRSTPIVLPPCLARARRKWCYIYREGEAAKLARTISPSKASLLHQTIASYYTYSLLRSPLFFSFFFILFPALASMGIRVA